MKKQLENNALCGFPRGLRLVSHTVPETKMAPPFYRLPCTSNTLERWIKINTTQVYRKCVKIITDPPVLSLYYNVCIYSMLGWLVVGLLLRIPTDRATIGKAKQYHTDLRCCGYLHTSLVSLMTHIGSKDHDVISMIILHCKLRAFTCSKHSDKHTLH